MVTVLIMACRRKREETAGSLLLRATEEKQKMTGRRRQPDFALAYRVCLLSVWGRSWGTVPHFGCDAARTHLEALFAKALGTGACSEWLSHDAITQSQYH